MAAPAFSPFASTVNPFPSSFNPGVVRQQPAFTTNDSLYEENVDDFNADVAANIVKEVEDREKKDAEAKQQRHLEGQVKKALRELKVAAQQKKAEIEFVLEVPEQLAYGYTPADYFGKFISALHERGFEAKSGVHPPELHTGPNGSNYTLAISFANALHRLKNPSSSLSFGGGFGLSSPFPSLSSAGASSSTSGSFGSAFGSPFAPVSKQ
jgi:hypothetical protein